MAEIDALIEEAVGRPLVGWDLSLDGRIAYAAPWDFDAIVDRLIGGARSLLDLGTGGGEWLSRRPFPKGATFATEAWPPNVAVARARLGPLGVPVVAVKGAPDNADQADAGALPALPFASAAFERVTCRHESFVATEVARVLGKGGRFASQQIASDFDAPMRALIGAPARAPARPWTLAVARRQLEASGLAVDAGDEGAATLAFADVGALAWYLIHVPWVVPEFEPSRFRPQLQALHERGPLAVSQPMFWLTAAKSGQRRSA